MLNQNVNIGQAICAVCKQNTHSAKMFSRHDVTSVSPYSKEPQRKVTFRSLGHKKKDINLLNKNL